MYFVHIPHIPLMHGLSDAACALSANKFAAWTRSSHPGQCWSDIPRLPVAKQMLMQDTKGPIAADKPGA